MRRNTFWFNVLLAAASTQIGVCQISSGSDGHDGAFNPTTNTVINMADHPDGIYHYTSVDVPAGVTVSFIPNALNKPVVWLVQSNVLINGMLDVSGQAATASSSGPAGPGGFRGGNGGTSPSKGDGPGGGAAGIEANAQDGVYDYGNSYLIPLIGGSGGGGSSGGAGGGGGGAILIAASGEIVLNGRISSNAGSPGYNYWYGGSGSGGAIRLVSRKIRGNGGISTWNNYHGGATGRIRIDTLDFDFNGWINGPYTRGFQPIVLPGSENGARLVISSIGGVNIPSQPSGLLSIPDGVIPAEQSTPVPVVVRCSNLPLKTPITITVRPADGLNLSASGQNTTGTLSSSTATILMNIPRGGGIIYATAAAGQ